MGRFDALTQLEKQPETPKSHAAVSSPAPASLSNPTLKTKPDSPSPKKQQKSQRYHDTTIPRHHDINRDTTTPRHHVPETPAIPDDLLEAVRIAMKHVGKEAATQRLTIEEKRTLRDIEYTYARQGIRTSGNEILRIATNYIIREYQRNGENSILAQVIKRLNS